MAVARLVVILASLLGCCHDIAVEVLLQMLFYMIGVRTALLASFQGDMRVVVLVPYRVGARLLR